MSANGPRSGWPCGGRCPLPCGLHKLPLTWGGRGPPCPRIRSGGLWTAAGGSTRGLCPSAIGDQPRGLARADREGGCKWLGPAPCPDTRPLGWSPLHSVVSFVVDAGFHSDLAGPQFPLGDNMCGDSSGHRCGDTWVTERNPVTVTLACNKPALNSGLKPQPLLLRAGRRLCPHGAFCLPSALGGLLTPAGLPPTPGRAPQPSLWPRGLSLCSPAGHAQVHEVTPALGGLHHHVRGSCILPAGESWGPPRSRSKAQKTQRRLVEA